MAASLRSVLSHMSADELARYKAAFHSYDADEDGYLNLGQALEALNSCGVPCTSGAMLDNLEDLEVAQEDELEATPWEQEQNRRRRRRRRRSLEQIEFPAQMAMAHGGHGTGQPAHKDDPVEEERREVARIAHLADHPPALTRSFSLENVPNGSSLKSPTIDISTFLNLARIPASQSAGGAPIIARTASQLGSMTPAARPAATPAPPVHLSSTAPMQPPARNTSGQTTPPEWERAGYQASAASAATGGGASARPYPNPIDRLPSEKRPPLRLRDHQQSLLALGLHPSLTPGSAPRRHGPGDDLDDDFDFDPEQDLLAAFHTFDPNKTGVMSCKNLVAIMTNLGEKWTEEEAMEMAEEVDTRREGRFNYNTLVKKLAARE